MLSSKQRLRAHHLCFDPLAKIDSLLENSADGATLPRTAIRRFVILNERARRDQHHVEFLPSSLFRGHGASRHTYSFDSLKASSQRGRNTFLYLQLSGERKYSGRRGRRWRAVSESLW